MFCYKQQVLWLNYRIVIQLFVPLRVKVHEMVESVFDLDCCILKQFVRHQRQQNHHLHVDV